jgi:hypothetical protein
MKTNLLISLHTIIILLCFKGYSQEPEAYYPFNDSTVNDISGNGFNGNPSNVKFVEGINCGTAAWFNGDNSVIMLGETLSSTFCSNTYSFSVWVYPLSYQDNYNKNTVNPDLFKMIIGRWDDDKFDFILTPGRFSVNNRDLDFKNVPLNVWSHLAVSIDSGEACVYIDGELVARDTGFFHSVGGCELSIGGIKYISPIWGNKAKNSIDNQPVPNPEEINAAISYANTFHGSIDDVRIYSSPLTQEQINTIRKENIFYDQYQAGIVTSSGKPVTLGSVANSKFQYLWNTGATTSQITVSSGKSAEKKYALNIIADGTCSMTDTIPVNWYSQFDNLVSRWTFNDSTSLANHATIFKAVKDTGIMCSKSFFYNGMDSYISLGDTLNDVFVNSDFTISFWAYLMDTVDIDDYKSVLINKWYTSTEPENAFVCYYNLFCFNNAFKYRKISFKTPPLNQWHNYVISKKSNLAKVYIDGKLEGTCYNAQLSPTSYPLILGANRKNLYNFKGNIDELKIFDRALFDGEIEQLYREGGIQELNRLTDTAVYCGTDLTLNAGDGFDRYSWYDKDTNQMKLFTNITAPVDSVSVLAVNQDGCFTDTISITIKQKHNIHITDKTEEEIKIWPCPAINEVNCTFSSNIPDKITIVDLQGKLILDSKVQGYSQKIDVSFLNPGMYVLQFHFNNGLFSKKLMIRE